MKLTEESFLAIKKLLNQRKESDSKKYYTDVSHFLEDHSTVEASLLPNILIWDPLHQLNPCPRLKCPLCESHHNSHLTKAMYWDDGSTNSRTPRIIWDNGWYCALVGRQYQCDNKHMIVSYQAGILQQIPSFEVPFLLSHESGVTCAVFDVISRLVDHGNPFRTVETILSEFLLDNFSRRVMKFPQSEQPNIETIFKPLSPAEGYIRKCFLLNYQANKLLYEQQLENVSVEFLSCRKFQSVGNIGYFHNKKWVTMYDSLFVMLNEEGMVLNFQFYDSTVSFEQVFELLSRLAKCHPDVKVIYLDNCCMWRNNLQELFPSAEVKLDVNQAILTLSEYLPKDHSLYSEVNNELALIFRDRDDVGRNRKLATPAVVDLSQNADIFTNKWNNSKPEDAVIFTEDFVCEYSKLVEHIKRGCLSHIPAGHCIDGDENLSKKILELIQKNRIGIDTALALVNSVIYYHNNRKKGNRFVPPIWSNRNNQCSGNMVHNISTMVGKEIDFATSSISSCANEEHITHSPKKIIALSQLFYNINETADPSIIGGLYRNQGFLTLPVNNWHPVMYLSCCREEEKMTDKEFSIFLSTLHLVKKPNLVTDTFVNVLALVIKDFLKLETMSEQYKSYLNVWNITEDCTVDQLVSSLIKLIFNELTGEKRFLYNQYIISADFQNQAQLFLEMKLTCTKFCDCIIAAASNVLGIAIIIVPSTHSLPLLPVFPEVILMFEKPIFISFTGSNDFAYLTAQTEEEIVKNQSFVFCRCGVNDVVPKTRCVSDPRCKCVLNEQNCNERCRCKGCFRGRPDSENVLDKKKCRRKRAHNAFSLQPERSSLSAALLHKDVMSVESVTAPQHFLLESILFFHLIETKSLLEGQCEDALVDQLLNQYIQIKYRISTLKITDFQQFTQSLLGIRRDSLQKWVICRMKK